MAASTSFLDLLKPLPPPEMRPPASTAAPSLDRRQNSADNDPSAAMSRVAEILQDAERKAQGILDDAAVQAEALREAAWQEGFHDGQTTARTSTETTVREEWALEKQEIRAQIQSMIDHIGTARTDLWERQESEMVALALTIARQVTKTEVQQNPLVVKSLIQNALRRVTDKDHVRIRVAAQDAPAVRALREELLETTDGIRQLEIVDDRRVGEGGCVIETAAGTIDAKIETQFSEVERALGITHDDTAAVDIDETSNA